jgi:hypothetical protein
MASNRGDRPHPLGGPDRGRTEVERTLIIESLLLEEQMRVLALRGKFKIDLAKTQIKSLELRARLLEL